MFPYIVTLLMGRGEKTNSDDIVPVIAVAFSNPSTTSIPALYSQPFCPESAFSTLFPPICTFSKLGVCSGSSEPMWTFSLTCGYCSASIPARLNGNEMLEKPGTCSPVLASNSEPRIHPSSPAWPSMSTKPRLNFLSESSEMDGLSQLPGMPKFEIWTPALSMNHPARL